MNMLSRTQVTLIDPRIGLVQTLVASVIEDKLLVTACFDNAHGAQLLGFLGSSLEAMLRRWLIDR